MSKCSIIDYSVLLIINTDTHTLRVGVIDYIQQYTLYKLLETTFKRALGKDDPTIISPFDYKERFLRALNKYFIGLYEEKMGSKFRKRKGSCHSRKGSANSNSKVDQIADGEMEKRTNGDGNDEENDQNSDLDLKVGL